jgi:2-polyprenyl-3-methyl-5-hydroxy-6-metoxy-1,4-benzoquinol methylase
MGNTVKQKIYANQGNQAVLDSIPEYAIKILDIGCGAGDNASILQQKQKIIDGITLSETEREAAIQYCRNVAIFNLEQGLPEDFLKNEYDACICSHVLEHICWSENVLRDISQVLKKNGVLIVALPNIMHYNFRLKLLKGNFDYQDSGVMDNTHFRWYTFETGKKLLENNGFIVKKAWVDGGLPFDRVFRYLGPSIREFIKQILFKISPGFFGGQLLYVATYSK